MGNCNMAAGMEMPGYATADLKGVQTVGTTKGGKNAVQAIISDFKKKLDSMAMTGQPAAAAQDTADTLGEDFSMARNTTAQELPQGVIGILEGFGLLDYQTETGTALADASQTTDIKAQVSDAAAETQQAQTSGQFARMLTNEQPGVMEADMPPQNSADAGKYSGSLESTNNQMGEAESVIAADSDELVQQLKAMMEADTVSQTSQPGTESVPVNQATAVNQSQVLSGQSQEMATDQPQTSSGQSQEAEVGQLQTTATDKPQTVTESVADTTVQAAPDKKAQDAQPATDRTMTAATPNTGAEASAAKALNATTQVDKAQTTEPQTTTAQSFVKDNVIRIVDKVSANAHEGRYEFDVELKPDFLGKVSIKLTMQDGEIRLHVRTDDLTVKGMFSDQTNSLTAALKEKGIDISTVDVSYQDPTATGREAFGQSGGGNGQKREGQIGWTADRYAGGELFDTATPAAELLGGSSVEYLA